MIGKIKWNVLLGWIFVWFCQILSENTWINEAYIGFVSNTGLVWPNCEQRIKYSFAWSYQVSAYPAPWQFGFVCLLKSRNMLIGQTLHVRVHEMPCRQKQFKHLHNSLKACDSKLPQVADWCCDETQRTHVFAFSQNRTSSIIHLVLWILLIQDNPYHFLGWFLVWLFFLCVL